MTHDPIRLLDDATAAASLRQDLGVAARYRPPYDVGAGAARFEASLAKGAGAASSGWGAGTLGVGALILGGLIGAGVWLTRPAASEVEPLAMNAGIAAEVAPPVPLEEIVPPLSARTGEGAVTAVATTLEAPASSVTPPEDVSEDRSEAGAPAEARKARVRRPVANRPPEAPSGPKSADYLREARSLQAARGFLGRDPAEALARAEAGAREFKAGAFAQEWEGVAILALFALDRRAEAEGRARAFLDRYPKGPYAAQVREALVRP